MWPTGSPHEEVGWPPPPHAMTQHRPSCSPVSLSGASEPPTPCPFPQQCSQPSPDLLADSLALTCGLQRPPTWAMTARPTAQTENEVTWARWAVCPLTPVLPPASVTVNFSCSGTRALVLLHHDPWGPAPAPAVPGRHSLPTSSALGGAQCDLSYDPRSHPGPPPPRVPAAPSLSRLRWKQLLWLDFVWPRAGAAWERGRQQDLSPWTQQGPGTL